MKTSDILLVVCSAKSATGSLTQEEKAVLIEWSTDWERRWKVAPSDQAIVVCNKMNAIAVGTAPIPKDEALQLIMQHNPMFASPFFTAMPLEQRLEQCTQMHAHMSDDDLDKQARMYKKPDEGPTRRLVEADATLVFTKHIVQHHGVHFVSANEALTRSRLGGAQPDEFQALRRCLLDRVEKAGPEKAARLLAAATREQELRLREQQRLAAAKAESAEAERRERARQAEADRKRQQAEQDECRRREQRIAAERAAYADRMSKRRDETWAKSVGAGAVATAGVGTAAVAVPTGGAMALTGVAGSIGLTGGTLAAAPVVAAGSVAAGVGLGIAIVAKQAMFDGGEHVSFEPYLGVGDAQRSTELRQLGISKLELSSSFLAYIITFENIERGNWAFEDEHGTQYKVSCLRKGTHRVLYNSNRPRITKVTRF
jgi:hypothetical protein